MSHRHSQQDHGRIITGTGTDTGTTTLWTVSLLGEGRIITDTETTTLWTVSLLGDGRIITETGTTILWTVLQLGDGRIITDTGPLGLFYQTLLKGLLNLSGGMRSTECPSIFRFQMMLIFEAI